MHADIEQLLALRDGAPVDEAVRAHLKSCSECQRELALLQASVAALRQLPSLRPPAGAWQRIEARLERSRPAYRPLRYALAATVVLALAAGLWLARPGQAPTGSEAAGPVPLAVEPASTPVVERGLDALLSESQRLERLLDAIETRAPQVMRTGTAGTIAGLEDRIALIDYGLMHAETLSADDSRQLWSRRVTLMNSLVQVRGATLQPVSN